MAALITVVLVCRGTECMRPAADLGKCAMPCVIKCMLEYTIYQLYIFADIRFYIYLKNNKVHAILYYYIVTDSSHLPSMVPVLGFHK